MKQPPGNVQPVLIGLALGLTIGVGVMDLVFPSGAVAGILYVCLVMLSLASDRRSLTFLAATAFTSLIAYDLLSTFTNPEDIPWRMMARVSLVLIALWVPVAAALATKRVQQHTERMNTPLHLCPSCKKIRDDQGVWSKLEDFLNQEMGRVTASGFCPGCRNKWTAGQASEYY